MTCVDFQAKKRVAAMDSSTFRARAESPPASSSRRGNGSQTPLSQHKMVCPGAPVKKKLRRQHYFDYDDDAGFAGGGGGSGNSLLDKFNDAATDR